MVVQHNLQAANADRQLSITTGQQAKSTEKLSSGYRINRAGDDAAGLAISEKMRSQIRGLDKASTNAEDGISVVQTAEGALNEVHSILQRMNELATQAANDTNTSVDRSQIKTEIDQLTLEIDRIASTTQFNTMNLLDGKFTSKNLQVGALSGQNIKIDIGAMRSSVLGLSAGTITRTRTTTTTTTTPGTSGTTTYTGGTASASSSNVILNVTDASKISKTATFGYNATGRGVNYTNNATITNSSLAPGVSVTLKSNTASFGTDVHAEGARIYYIESGTQISDTETASSSGWAYIRANGGHSTADNDLWSELGKSGTSVAYVNDKLNVTGSPTQGNYIDATPYSHGTRTTPVWQNNSDTNEYYTAEQFESTFGVSISFASGYTPNATDSLSISLTAGTQTTTPGSSGSTSTTTTTSTYTQIVGGLEVDSFSNAGDAMDRIQNAIDIVSKQRANLGAIQNRLEHTIANLDTTSENTSAAESRIRDTDMASEMVNYSKNNILAQAGQSMLAQANQSTQGALSLLG